MEITKQGAPSSRMKMRNSELYLKGKPHAARLPKLESKLEKLLLDCFHCFFSEQKREYLSKLSTFDFHSSGKMTRAVATKQVSVTSLHVGVEHFTKIKLNKYLLLTEFEGRTVSYGPSFFPPRFMAKARSARAINRRGKNEDP